MVTDSNSITPVQSGVNRLVNLLNDDDGLIQDAIWFANMQLRDNGYNDEQITELKENHESLEDTPIYNDYYRFMSLFQKRVCQAATAIL